LLNAKAKPTLKDNWGNTPIHLSALFGHEDCLQALLDGIEDKSLIDNQEMIQHFQGFIDVLSKELNLVTIFNYLSRTLSNLTKPKVHAIHFRSAPPQPIVSKDKSAENQSPIEIARQITLIEYDRYQSMQANDWIDKDNPNLRFLLSFYDHILKLLHHEIETTQTKQLVLQKWIQIAIELKNYQNLHGMREITLALQSIIIELKDYWNVLPQNLQKKFDEVTLLNEDVISHLHILNPPAIPHIPSHLNEINAIFAQPTFLDGRKEKLINWTRLSKLHSLIIVLLQYQQLPYSFESVPFIQQYLLTGFQVN